MESRKHVGAEAGTYELVADLDQRPRHLSAALALPPLDEYRPGDFT
jgi:hypothetical protein